MRINSLHLRLVSQFGALFLLISIALTVYLDHIASSTLNSAKSDEIYAIANSTAMLLARKLHEREREIALLSKSYTLTELALPSYPLKVRLQQLQQSYPFYAWIGVVGADGTVLAATNNMLEGQNVAHRPWFTAGIQRPYVGDVHEAVLLEKLLGKTSADPLRFIDFAAPVYNADGTVRAVVATHVNWDWVHDVVNLIHSEDATSALEILILSQHGQWLHPFKHIGKLSVPIALPAPGKVALVDWPAEGRFLTARVNVKNQVATHSDELGWQVVLRQPLKTALKPVAELNRQLFIFCFFTMLVGMVSAYWLAGVFSRPIEKLAKAAEQVAQGEENVEFAVGSSLEEVRHLSQALRSMMTNLALKRRALEHANDNLERQVLARTAELEQANSALQQLTVKDALTSIANRRAADEKLHTLFAMLQRAAQHYAVLLLDIDHFKRINDNFGHDVGDQVIRRVAILLQSQLRESDMVARYGGEEFIVILPGSTLAGALIIAEKLCSSVAADRLPEVGQVTVSIGVAQASAGHDHAETVVRLADAAMYQAKRAGRNRVVSAAEGS